MIPMFKKYKVGDRPSANDLNRRGNVLQGLANSSGANAIMDSTGIHTRNRSGAGVGGTDIRIFEVQSRTEEIGDGNYICYEQTIDATEWTDTAGDDKVDDLNTTEVTVWNLLENDCEATYSSALAKYDLIAAWQDTDDEDNDRWIGVPLVSYPRRARANAAAGAATTLTCNLIDRNGTEITSGLGYNITVNADICGGGNLNAAVPRIADDDYVWVVNIQGKWYFNFMFMASEECTCGA